MIKYDKEKSCSKCNILLPLTNFHKNDPFELLRPYIEKICDMYSNGIIAVTNDLINDNTKFELPVCIPDLCIINKNAIENDSETETDSEEGRR